MVQKSDWVIRGRVEAIQTVKDSDDPEGIAGWLYHFHISWPCKAILDSVQLKHHF
jgi:hypothetical protein